MEKTIFFDRGYGFSESINGGGLINSPELIAQQLMAGDAHFAVMPLRLAVHLSKQLNFQEIQIRPLGHQPFAYRWFISDQDRILHSIVQKSLHAADPFFMGELLAIPSLASDRSQHVINWLWFGIAGSSGLIAILLGFFAWQRKKQLRTEADLMDIAQEARDASEAKSAFLATVSHEIRTPMHAVIGAQELLLKNSALNQHQRELLQSAHTSAASLLGMLNQVLDIAKIEAGKFTVEHEPRFAEDVQAMVRSADVSNVALVTAELKDGWYDLADDMASLPEQFGLAFVDGPPRKDGDRMKFFETFGRRCKVILCDDANNPIYARELKAWAAANGRQYRSDGRAGVITQ